MTELEILKKIAADIEHMRSDIEEIKESIYPPEEKISEECIVKVKQAQKSRREGKVTRATSVEEIRAFLKWILR